MPGLTQEHDGLEALVQSLREKLGPCSGIDSADVDSCQLQQLMEEYTSEESEWSKYYFPSPNMAYTRNLVDKGNGKSNLYGLLEGAVLFTRDMPVRMPPSDTLKLLAICHANAHCIMKVLKGSLAEVRYAWPTVDLNNAEDHPLQVISEKVYEENQVTYMSDRLGLHRIKNMDPNGYAVSLHLYTPPNAAVYGCNIFDEETGQAKHVKKCTVFSEYGCALRDQRAA